MKGKEQRDEVGIGFGRIRDIGPLGSNRCGIRDEGRVAMGRGCSGIGGIFSDRKSVAAWVTMIIGVFILGTRYYSLHFSIPGVIRTYFFTHPAHRDRARLAVEIPKRLISKLLKNAHQSRASRDFPSSFVIAAYVQVRL